MRTEHQRIAHAIAVAAAPKALATARDDVLAYFAQRFALTTEQRARITGATMGGMVQEAYALDPSHAPAPAVAVAPTLPIDPALRPALVSGRGVPDYAPTFDARGSGSPGSQRLINGGPTALQCPVGSATSPDPVPRARASPWIHPPPTSQPKKKPTKVMSTVTALATVP
jgi:hypothetical protein